jgi:hypothetical protein
LEAQPTNGSVFVPELKHLAPQSASATSVLRYRDLLQVASLFLRTKAIVGAQEEGVHDDILSSPPMISRADFPCAQGISYGCSYVRRQPHKSQLHLSAPNCGIK